MVSVTILDSAQQGPRNPLTVQSFTTKRVSSQIGSSESVCPGRIHRVLRFVSLACVTAYGTGRVYTQG